MSRYNAAESEGLQSIPDHNAPETVHQNVIPPYTSQPPFNGGTSKDYNEGFPPDFSENKAIAGPQSKSIIGMRMSTLILSVLFLAASIAAIVAGSVLGSRKTSSSCPPMSPQTNQTSSLPPSSGTNNTTANSTEAFVAPFPVNVALDCPNINGQTVKPFYTPSGTYYSYQITCGQDCYAHDVVTIWSYSLDNCVSACVSFSRYNYTGMQCGAVVFGPDMGNRTNLGGNCFLKQGGCSQVDSPGMIASAVLLTLP